MCTCWSQEAVHFSRRPFCWGVTVAVYLMATPEKRLGRIRHHHGVHGNGNAPTEESLREVWIGSCDQEQVRTNELVHTPTLLDTTNQSLVWSHQQHHLLSSTKAFKSYKFTLPCLALSLSITIRTCTVGYRQSSLQACTSATSWYTHQRHTQQI